MAKLELKDRDLEFAFKNAGKLPGKEDRITLSDAMSVPNAPMLFPKVISNIVKEAIEPLLIGTALLQRIDYKYGQTITFGATGSLFAGDIAEGMEYPEQTMNTAAGTVVANIGKSGIAIKVTDEMIRYSQFDIIGMHLRAAGRALARHKEVKIFNMIRSQGVTIFDNAAPTSSLKGVTTGRDLTGAANASLTMDDVFDAWAHILMQGFMPNTLIMHPLTWAMFVKDATLRSFVLANGGGSFFASWNGNPQGGTPQWANSSMGGLGMSPGQNLVPGGNAAGLTATTALEQSQTQNGAPVLPSYGPGGLSIVVTPFVPFSPATKLTDIYLCDRNELGFLIVDEDPTTEEFDDPRVDIRKIKIRERYALAMNNEGHAVGVIRNVKVVPNEIVLPGTVQVTGLSAISPTVALV
jgi:hypothetical protein